MHLLVPFASDTSEACRHVLEDLALPHLAELLGLFTLHERDDADPNSLSPPHERALAAAWGWRGDDGCLPFAAHAAAAAGLEVADQAWGLLSPVHWQLGRDQVVMADPDELGLADDDSRQLFAAVRELFESEGFAVAYADATHWYVAHADLAGHATASPDRVIGRSVDRWLGAAATPAARRLRRLQSEAQLVLHEHAVNDRREEGGDVPVNSLWLSGCGRLQAVDPAKTPRIDAALRRPWLAADWAAWAEAWRSLDGGAVAALLAAARRGEPARLTLCGERSFARWESGKPSLWRRVAGRWKAGSAAAVLATL